MINRNQLRLSRLTLGLLAALATAPAFAQSTSASVGGQVTGNDGVPVTGAQVTILHTDSGTVSRTTTNAEGRYVSRGLRLGGPYTITIQRDGYQPIVQDGVFLSSIDDVQQVNAALNVSATTLEAVQVRAGRPDDVFDTGKMGTSSVIGREKIEAFASIKRDLQDYARLDPRISQTNKQRSEISAIGQNVRFNSITIDGVSINDTFGLEGNNLPTAKQPISIDAIEQVEVNIANYDVTQSRYSGANINAVTKSGGNEFHGGLLYVNLDDSRVGDDAGQSFNGFSKQETYGGTFSGPLIKDKLFFFISYEDFKSSDIAPDVRIGNADGVDEPNEVDAVSQAIIDQVAAIASSRFNIADIGSFNLGGDNDVEDILVKIDWNINDAHRAVFRYNRTQESIRNVSNLSAAFNDLSLSTTWWDQAKEVEGIVGQLYSDWSDNFSTELKFSYRDFSSAPVFQQRLPFVSIGVGSSDLFFGLDRFRPANNLQTETYNGYFQGDWYLGDHTVRFGVDYERNEIFNLFVQDAFGNYRFNSIADFENNRPRSFIFRSSVTGDVNDAAADFALENYAFFVQDSWQVNSNLSLMLGVRVDVPNVDGRPAFNSVASQTFGFANDTTIDGQELFQPRFGFNYSFDTTYKTQLRGGLGLFQGNAANVWLANPFTNNGLSLVDFGCGTGGLDRCPSDPALLPQFTGDPDNQPQFVSGSQAPSAVDILAKDLQQPSNWKFNIALDKELANGWVVSGEALFSETDHGIQVQHLNLGDPTAIGPDGRQMFWNAAGFNRANWDINGRSDRSVSSRDLRDRAFGDVILSRDTGKGNGQSYSITLSDPTLDNWYWAVGYAYTNAEEVSPLTSSRAISNWNNNAAFNPNDSVSATANTEIRNRITAAVSWKHEFFKGYSTAVSAFYEGRSGTPFSYTFDNDANGDGRSGNDLLFIPGARGDVIFGSQEEEDGFFAFLADNPDLARLAGTTAKRNGARSSWVNNVDLRFTQEVPGFFKGHKGLFAIDMLNVGNLIDSDWGHVNTVPFPFNRGIVEFGGIQDGKFVYRFNNPDQPSRLTDQGSTLASRWQVQATLRYTF